MTDLLHRTLRRLDHFAMTVFTPITPLGVCVALGGPRVVSLPLRPHEWIAVSATPFACCRTPRRVVTAVGQGAAVTDAVRLARDGVRQQCRTTASPHPWQHHRTLCGAVTPHPAVAARPRRSRRPRMWTSFTIPVPVVADRLKSAIGPRRVVARSCQ